MACGKSGTVLLLLVSLAYVLAEEGSGHREEGSGHREENHNHEHHEQDRALSFTGPFGSFGMGSANGIGLPNFPQLFGLGSNGSSPFGQLFASFLNPNSTGLASMFPFFPNFGGSRLDQVHGDMEVEGQHDHSSRLERVHGTEDHSDTDPSDRFFFSHAVRVNCNYTATKCSKEGVFFCQPGARCTGCKERTICYPSNRGVVRVCTLFPYCNNGRCSRIPGSACTTTSSSTVAPTTVAPTTVAPTTV